MKGVPPTREDGSCVDCALDGVLGGSPHARGRFSDAVADSTTAVGFPPRARTVRMTSSTDCCSTWVPPTREDGS